MKARSKISKRSKIPDIPGKPRIPDVPEIPDHERTSSVATLLEIVRLVKEENQELRDVIARLIGEKPKPQIKPSALEKDARKDGSRKNDGKRPGSAKRKKTANLKIHETITIPTENVPAGSRFKGYEYFIVQGLVFKAHNRLYRRQRWQTQMGDFIVAPLPDDVEKLGHFDEPLHRFVLYQYYHCRVTRPMILEQLLELEIDISAGQVDHILTQGKESFHQEKDEILRVGLEISNYINVDDTSARHRGKNGYCTHIGNEIFAWFDSNNSKSRLNFLSILRAGRKDYVLNAAALDYMDIHGLPKAQMELLVGHGKSVFEDYAQWNSALESLGFVLERHIRIATEGALLGSIREHGALNPDLVILSDAAGQFAILLHALCWIHAERSINRLVGFNDEQRKALVHVRTLIWEFYAELKTYKQHPSSEKKAELQQRFDEIFTKRTCYESLNQAMTRIQKNKAELLLVLDRPEVPLHNNASEKDIREYAQIRKISGSTRSDHGRRCRDTFASLKKTCRKLKVGFWQYLGDRLSGRNGIPWLSDLMRQQMGESPG